jgi:uncharacterized protein (TIGR03083 family)
MNQTKGNIPIDVVNLLPVLNDSLTALLRSLTAAQWQQQTIARQWKVKDVAAHLLDGNIRSLSMLRDNYYAYQPDITSHQDLLDYLNGLNAEWVNAMKRVSPAMLIVLHEATGKAYCDYYASLDPFGKAGFSVDWAGENESKNWMHIAREYTEKWLHQQQIRDAVGIPELMTKELFIPFISIFMLALPHTFRDVPAEEGTTVQLTIPGEIGGSWGIIRKDGIWLLNNEMITNPSSQVIIDADISWRLFSKSIRPEEVIDQIIITGNHELGMVALSMVSVMA